MFKMKNSLTYKKRLFQRLDDRTLNPSLSVFLIITQVKTPLYCHHWANQTPLSCCNIGKKNNIRRKFHALCHL